MKKITFLFLLTGFWVFGQDFVDVTGSLPQLTFGFSAFGDYDGDGDLDLYYTGQLNANSNGGGLYHNDSGTFSLVTNSGLPILNTGAADWGDVDGDGDMDLVIMGYDNNAGVTDVYVNNGNGTFTASNAGLHNSYMGDVVFGDYDNDGDLDIALTGMETTNWTFFSKVYENDGNGNFSESNLNLPPMNYGKIKFVDFDNDGDIDITLGGWNDTTNTPYTKVWQNDGSQNFTELNLGFPQLWLGDFEWGDVDGDGDLDFVITGTPNQDSEAHLMLNNNNTFTDDPHFNITGAHRVASIELADFDVNGSLDVFITGVNVAGSNENLIAKLYENNGSGLFVENTNESFAAVQYCDADAADYDNDGETDLFITGVDANFFGVGKLYHNEHPNSISEDFANKFTIYPNPAHDILNISNQAQFNYNVQITDLTGKSIFNQPVEGNIRIDVSNFPTGMYLVKISDHKNSFVQKLIIK